MFNFIKDIGNYEDRCVGRYDDPDTKVFISTVLISDGKKPYETGVAHPDYNGGELVIVENYDTRELADEGHGRWVDIMTKEPLPEKLVDCQNAMLHDLAHTVLGSEEWDKHLTYFRKKEDK